MKGVPTRQLLMIVRGTAGTGKSLLLNAITKTFESEGAAHLLFKTAMSGVAASLIGGSTLHWWGGIPAKKIPQEDDWMDSSSKAIKQRREENIAPIEWLAVDEISMMTTSMMALISQVAGKVRNGNGAMDSTVPFGGLNLILIGDFHQFEPVANPRSSLYSQPRSDRKEKLTSVIGRNLWAQFETVVTLTEQKRIIDPGWRRCKDHGLEIAIEKICTRYANWFSQILSAMFRISIKLHGTSQSWLLHAIA